MSPPEQSQPPEVIASRIAHERFLTLRVDTLRYASGREEAIDVIDHPGGVTLVALDSEGRVLLVRQYRHPARRDLLELPAGALERGETPDHCADRELQEETGYRARRLERIGGFYLAPGYCSEYQHVYLASDLSESKLEGDEEAIDVEPTPLDDVLRLIAAGEIEDAKTVGALFLYLQMRDLVSAD